MGIEKAPLAELQEEFARLAEVVATASNRRQKSHDEIERRTKIATATVWLNQLTPEYKDALREALKT